MQVICDRRDQDLLFLSHGLVTGLKKLLLKLHLKRCSSCQSRLAEFNIASQALRVAVGGRVRNVAVAPQTTQPRLAWVLVVLLLLGGAYAMYFIATYEMEPEGVPPKHQYGIPHPTDGPKPKAKAKHLEPL